jgi:Rrf2 family protein
VHIARNSAGAASGDAIARAENVSKPILGKVLQDLVRKGLLVSRRGPGGGFQLARRADLITLRDIVAARTGSTISCAAQQVSPSATTIPLVPFTTSGNLSAPT